MATTTLDACLRETLTAQRTDDATQVVARGSVTAALLDLVDERDLVVVGRRRATGWAGFSLNSVERRLLEHVPGSTVVVPAAQG